MHSLRRLSFLTLTAFAAASLLWSSALVTGTALGLGPAASAQGAPGGGPGGGGGQRGQRFAKLLMDLRPPLSDVQKAQIRKLRDQMRSQYRNQPPSSNPDDRRARFRAFMDKIRGVLTPAQQRDFDAKMQAMRNRQGQR
jgi:Spy/CpxP family protein refolding chaperone